MKKIYLSPTGIALLVLAGKLIAETTVPMTNTSTQSSMIQSENGRGAFLTGTLAQSEQTVSIAAPPSAAKIVITDPPVSSPNSRENVPREAYDPSREETSSPMAAHPPVSFADLVADRISTITVMRSDPKRFKTHVQIEAFLRDLMSSTATETYSWHIWSNGEAMPCLTATVDHAVGIRGRLVVWCEDPLPAEPPRRTQASPGNLRWAYQDDDGRWWWAQFDSKASLPNSMGTVQSPNLSKMESILRELPSHVSELTVTSVLAWENTAEGDYSIPPTPAVPTDNHNPPTGVGVAIASYDSLDEAEAGVELSLKMTELAPTQVSRFGGNASVYKWDQNGRLRVLTRVGQYVIDVYGPSKTLVEKTFESIIIREPEL